METTTQGLGVRGGPMPVGAVFRVYRVHGFRV